MRHELPGISLERLQVAISEDKAFNQAHNMSKTGSVTDRPNRNARNNPWVKWGLWFGLWTGIALAFTGQSYLTNVRAGELTPWHELLFWSVSEWYLWALLSLPIAWLARRYPFEELGWGFSLMLHLPACMLIAIVFTLLRSVIWAFQEFGTVNLVTQILTYLIISGATQAFDYYGKFVARTVRAAELEKQLAQAQLQALQMQLNPHFLFNTLHAISSLMHKDVEAADRMIAQLGDLLRYTLESTNTQEVPLKQELDFLERYLEIEQTRFGDRLTVRMEIAPDTLEASVPNLILQPLVENAIHHGVAPHAKPGKIELHARRENETLRLEVTDNGTGLQDTKSSGMGIGLSNTRARLQQLYGAAHQLELQNGPSGGLCVRVTIPFRINTSGAGQGAATK